MEPQAESFWALFNWLDIVLSVGLVAALLVGVGAGFYRQVAITVSLVGGLLLASQLTTPIAHADFWQPVHARFGTAGAESIAYGGIVLVCLLLGLLSILLFRSYFGKKLRILDSVLGGFSGVAIGALLAGMVILGICRLEDHELQQPIRDSYIGSHLAEGAKVASRAFPEEFRTSVERSLDQKISDLSGSLRESSDLPPSGSSPADAGKATDSPGSAPTPGEAVERR